MRMWMINPMLLCRKHLLGEHNEIHKLVGTVQKGKSIRGYVENGLVDIRLAKSRHDELVIEMLRRNYTHNSPIPTLLFVGFEICKIDRKRNLIDLKARCETCKRNIEKAENIYGL